MESFHAAKHDPFFCSMQAFSKITGIKCASINGHIAFVGRLLRFTDIDPADALVFALEGGHQTMIDYLNVYLDEQNHLELDSFGSANSAL